MPTVFTFDELWRGRTAGVRAGQPRRFDDAWACVVTGDSIATPATRVEVVNAFSAAQLLFIGTPHRDWPAARCVAINASCSDESPSVWEILTEFSEPTPPPGTQIGGDPAGEHEHENVEPIERPPNLTTTYRLEPVYEQKDFEGEPYVNSAGDLLENAPPRMKAITILNWTRCYDEWDAAFGASVMNAVNLDLWQGYEPATAKIVGCPAKLTKDGGYIFWEVAWTVEVDYEGWIPTKVLDIGRNVTRIDGEKISVTDAYGRGLTGPVLLDGAGNILQEGEPPVFLEFTNNDQISFDFLDA